MEQILHAGADRLNHTVQLKRIADQEHGFLTLRFTDGLDERQWIALNAAVVENEETEVFLAQRYADVVSVGKGAPVEPRFSDYDRTRARLIAELFYEEDLRRHRWRHSRLTSDGLDRNLRGIGYFSRTSVVKIAD